ncbi:transglutaminase-like cysteine peptidase [Alsobacter sp. SYSU M60028]|uniref:Transglutaminase-like cysteine peptidase n=1 Tax=Alsobacter ponti TaxID=2962936 RepID=A0ABT1LHJ5_9HYPH|nr:transglutaminase-like cysteine peptidase [Alsobacter ponti]MCP8940343.1 transglutaminase-like cysteine peptidase [Alsobacter ponti]
MRFGGGVLAGLASLVLVAGVCGAEARGPLRIGQEARRAEATSSIRPGRVAPPAVLPAVTSPTPVEEETRPPIGWVDFCRNGHPEDCAARPLAPETIALTTALWQRLVAVNRHVNSTIQQVEDIALYGVQERWTYPDNGKGDCEDLALLKRRMLIAEGFPRQALLMTVVRDEVGAGHAILTVVTDRGDFILDSKTNRVLPWSGTGYGFVKRQSQMNPNLWVRLGEPASPGLTVAGH